MADRNTRIKGSQIQADTVEPSDLKATNSPLDTLVPSYDVVTGQFTWVVAGGAQTAETTPTEDSGISVQDALNTLEADKHPASGQFNQTIAAEISGLTAKTTPIDADVTLIEDSATTPTAFLKKKLTWAQIKATLKTYFDGLYQATGAYLSNLVEDTTPQLGGDLDLNGKNIDFPTTANISDCLDEDNMVSNSATKLATQQSIKAYADTKTTLAAAQAVLVKNDGTVNPTNLLFNGDFENWNAGTAVAPDGWLLSGGSVAREGTIKNIGSYSAKLTRAGSDCYLYVDWGSGGRGIAYWKGRTLTFGARIYATIADRARLVMSDTGADSFSAYHTGDSTWQWLTVTRTIPANATSLYFDLAVMTGDTSAYIDGAMLVEGESAFAFADKPASEGVWADYFATSTIVGWAAGMIGNIMVKKIGKTVFVQYSLIGTSNATTATFTVPHVCSNSPIMGGLAITSQIRDNSVNLSNPGYVYLPSNTGGGIVVKIYKDMAETVWTASGSKGVSGQFFYESA